MSLLLLLLSLLLLLLLLSCYKQTNDANTRQNTVCLQYLQLRWMWHLPLSVIAHSCLRNVEGTPRAFCADCAVILVSSIFNNIMFIVLGMMLYVQWECFHSDVISLLRDCRRHVDRSCRGYQFFRTDQFPLRSILILSVSVYRNSAVFFTINTQSGNSMIISNTSPIQA